MARSKFNVDDKDKKKVTKQGLAKALKVFRYIGPYKYTFAAGFIFLIVSGLTSMVFPFITGKLVAHRRSACARVVLLFTNSVIC